MRYEKNTLDYFGLLKDAQNLNPPDTSKTIRLAILADCATQHLVTMIKVLGAKNGVNIEVYEGGYDEIDLEILNPSSGLYAYSPQYVIVLTSSQKLKGRLFDTEDRKAFVSEAVGRLEISGALSGPTARPQSFKAHSFSRTNELLAIMS